jgi:hypothetical protein
MAHRDVTQSNLYSSLPKLEGRVLEYGSGDSQVAATLAEKGVNIFTYEPNQVLPKSKTPVDYSNGWDIREKFDNIIALNIGNVDKYAEQTIIQDVFDKLKIGGKAYLAATNLPNAQRVLNNNAKITKKGKLIEVQRTGLATRPRFQIIGARGLNKEASIAYKAGDTQSLATVNTDMRNLKLAQSLRSMGIHNEIILNMTGWQMSKLGHWSKVAIDLQYNDEAFMLPLLENINRYTKTGKTTRKPIFSAKIKDFITGKDAERLFNQYPELKDFTFSLKYLPKDTLGLFSSKNKTIELNANELVLKNYQLGPDVFQYIQILFNSGLSAKQVHDFLLSPDADLVVRKKYKSLYHKYSTTIYHEVQHLIQNVEGWMTGSSETYIKDVKKEVKLSFIAEYANNKDRYDKLLEKYLYHFRKKAALEIENKPVNEKLQKTIDDLSNQLQKVKPIISEYLKDPVNIKSLGISYFSIKGISDAALNIYENTGGEIQARAAEKLYGMSPAEKASFIIDEFIIGEKLSKKYGEPLDVPTTDSESYKRISYRYTKGQVRPGAIATIKDGFIDEFETELLIDLADKFHALRLPFYMQSFEIMKLTARYINDQSRVNKSALISSLLRYDPDSDTGLDRVGRKVNKVAPDSVKVADVKKKIKAAKTGPLTIESAKRIYELIAGFSLTSVNILQGKGKPTPPIARYQIDPKVKNMPAKVKMNMFEGVGLPDVLKYQGLKYVPENNRKSIDIISDSVEELSYTQLSQISSILKEKHPDVNKDKYDRLTDLMDKAIVALQTNSDNRAVEFLLQLRKMDTTKIDDHHYKTTLQSLTFGTPTRVALNRYIAATMAYLAAPIRNPVQPRFQIDGEIVPMQMTGGTIKLSQAEKSRAAYIKRKDKDKNVSDTDIVRALMNAYGISQEIAIAELQYALKRKFIPEPNLTNANLIKAYNKAQSFLNRSRIVNGIVRRWSEFEFTMVDDNKIIKRYEEKVYEREAYFYALAEVIKQFNIVPQGDMTSVEIATKKYKKEIAKRKKQFLKGRSIDSRLQVWAMNATKNTKASFYEEQLMIKLYGGDRSNPRFKARRKKSLIGIAEANGISYQELNDFLFYRHIPERIDRKNDYIK